jgi:glutamyl-tRNA synthetase
MDNLNAHYLRQLDAKLLTKMICENLQKTYKITTEETEYIKQAMPNLKIRSTNLVELAELAKIYLINVPIIYSEEAKEIIKNCDKNLLEQVIEELKNLQNFDKDLIQIKFKEIAKNNNIKLADLMQSIRSLITGMTASPSIFEIIAIIGKENAIARLKCILLVNEELIDEDQNHEVLGVKGLRSGAYI